MKKSGKLVTENGEYIGKFKNGEMEDTNGQFIWNNKNEYKGGFVNGKMHGQGTLTFANGQVAQGVWNKGEN